MRELVTSGKMLIGYSSMIAPANEKETGKVYKMLRLLSTEQYEGDIHFFEWKGNAWILAPDHSYINLSGNENLIDLYQNLPRCQEIEFYSFIRLIAQAL
jgi:hypothetical protein